MYTEQDAFRDLVSLEAVCIDRPAKAKELAAIMRTLKHIGSVVHRIDVDGNSVPFVHWWTQTTDWKAYTRTEFAFQMLRMAETGNVIMR